MSKIEERDRITEIIQKFTLFSNVFMKVVFRDVPACQHVLRILTGDKNLEVSNVRTEYEIAKVKSRDSRLDVLAETGNRALYNLELQRDQYLDHAKRVRFYNAMVDSEMLEKGTEYDELPDLTTYYISETDLWKKGQTSYRLEKNLTKTNAPYPDGVDIIYVNAEVDDHSEVAQLMKYFKTADPHDNSQGELSKRVHFLKCEEEGRKIMCKVTDELVEYGMELGEARGKEIGRELGIKSIVLRMAGRGKKLNEILADTGISLEVAERWLKEAAMIPV